VETSSMTWLMAAFRLEWLLMALLLTAALMAWAMRRGRSSDLGGLTWAVVGVLSLWALAALGLALVLRFKIQSYPHWFYHDLARAALFFAGAALIAWRGRRQVGPDPDGPRAAASWPMGRLFAMAAAAALLWGVTLWAFCAHAAAQVEAARRDARELALSMEPPAVQEERNSAGVYRSAFAMASDLPMADDAEREEVRSWFSTQDWDNAPSAKMLEHLKRGEPALSELRRALALDDFRIGRDYARPSLDEFLHTDDWYRARDLLTIDARARCFHGDTVGALRDVAAMRRMAYHRSKDPTCSYMDNALKLYSSAAWLLEAILARTQPSADALKVVPLVGNVDLEKSWRLALHLEEAVSLAEIAMVEEVAFDQTRVIGDESLPVRLFAKPSFRLWLIGWRTFYLAPDLADYRARMRAVHGLAAKPYSEARDGWRQWSRDREDRPHGVITELFLHNFDAWARGSSMNMARTRLTDLALAATNYRAQHGLYPTTAEDLIPAFISAIPEDPFDSRPLRMRVAGDGLLLYSVADDGRDDGGAERDYRTRTGDITFCLGTKLWRERRDASARARTDKSNPGEAGK
jgi:hypothetical protein